MIGSSDAMTDSRVLVIGLDGATWSVLEPFMAAGKMPNLTRLRSAGSWGDLRSTIPPLSAPAWATFLTGKSPARHGVFHFVDWRSGGLVDGRSIDSPLLWDILAHGGRSTGVINVPMSYPPRPVNGLLITGLLTPPGTAVFTHPPELSRELADYQIDLDRFIADKPFAEAGTKREVKPDLQLVKEFDTMETIRGTTARRLMDTLDWDVFTVVFTGTDRMGHYLWPYHRAEDLDGSAEAVALHEAIKEFYANLDSMIGELVEAAGPETAVLVISDHGMGPIYTKNTHWNNWLYRAGFVRLEQKSRRTLDGWLLRLGIPRDRLRRLAALLPGVTRTKTAKALKNAPTAEIDRSASTAYYERWFDPVGGIRVNATGEERESIITTLMGEIATLTDPETGQPIVREILRREDCLDGPHLEMAPDIVVVMNPDYGSSDRVSNYSSIVTSRPRISDPGGHQIEGIFVAAGAGLARSPSPLDDLRIEDIAPTVLHLSGLAVPTDMDGRVLTPLFAVGGPHDRPVEASDPPGRWPDEATARNADASAESDEEAVRERLRALGYFE